MMMKQKIFVGSALILLVAVIGFIAYDLFFPSVGSEKNPYELDLSVVKSEGLDKIHYQETDSIKPTMEEVHGVAVDRKDRIYVCGKNTVEIFSNDGKLLLTFPVSGVANCLAADDHCIVVGIADHLEVFDMEGVRTARWRRISPESIVTSVALHNSMVYVADAGQKIVLKFDGEGKLFQRIGQKDPAGNIPGFVVPSPFFDLGIGIDGTLWVVNPGRHSLENYNADGHLLASWGTASNSVDGFCGCCNPTHFAFLTDGSYVTSEKGIERVKLYSKKGEFAAIVAPPEMFDEGVKGLDLAVDSKDRILVLDPSRKLIRIFVKKPVK